MARRLVTAVMVAAVAVVGVAAPAWAGSCPVCASDADCPAGDFCVVHDSDVGCGNMLSLCCPGQACSTQSGRPSCEGTTCKVMCGEAADCVGAGATCEMSPSSLASWCASPDASCADSGKRWQGTAGDALAGTCVAGVAAPDAAPGTPDAAPATPDADLGGGDDGATADDCGCHAGSSPGASTLATVLLLGLALAGAATGRRRH